MTPKKKLLVITGPTATGKTALGRQLAERFNGEILSADSRQVYKYMDIGTGKDTTHFQWGIDLVEPGQPFSVSDWVNYANKILADIWKRNKLPIIVGGAGQYIKELLYPSATLHIPPNKELRSKNYELRELQDQLRKTNPERWGKMNNSDRNNPRRLIRAMEVTGSKLKIQSSKLDADIFIIGLTAPLKVLYRRIDQRVEERIKEGMAVERKMLKKYPLPKTIGYGGETEQEWRLAEHAYARRQLTYLRHQIPDICWFGMTTPNYQANVVAKVSRWYSGSGGCEKNQTGNG